MLIFAGVSLGWGNLVLVGYLGVLAVAKAHLRDLAASYRASARDHLIAWGLQFRVLGIGQ